MKKSKFYLLVILTFLCLMPNVLFAQSLTVEGTVKDETREPLIGVTVQVQGQGVGATTGLDGKYHIEPVKRGATLEFSYMGCFTHSVKDESRRIDVSLEPDLRGGSR